MNEHPDPQRRRDSCILLDGADWTFAFDDKDEGLDSGWYRDPSRFSKHIKVPFAYQWPESGIGKTDKHNVVWYGHRFTVPRIRDDERILLHFQAVDYDATVFVNGQQVTRHEGGHVPFDVDITHALFPKLDHHRTSALLVVRVEDLYSSEQPRGKQSASNSPQGIWYTNTTGIWQSVWLEVVNKCRIEAKSLALIPDIDRGSIRVDIDATVPLDPDYYECDVRISLRGALVASSRIASSSGSTSLIDETMPSFDNIAADHDLFFKGQRASVEIPLGQIGDAAHKGIELWSPESPTLYDVQLRLYDVQTGRVVDELHSYVGMRKISIGKGRICLNNKPYYQRLVLDQGYWPQSGMTPPSDEALIRDIELAKSFGFNGARKHMKPEVPRWLYHCDRLGFLVWAESAAAFVFTSRATRRLQNELAAIIERDISHPCIVTWCCINEDWGVPDLQDGGRIGRQQRDYLETLRSLCKTLDPHRLVSVNDGGVNITTTDIVGIHDYSSTSDLERHWKDIQQNVRKGNWDSRSNEFWAPEQHYNGQPIVCSELGGYLPPGNQMLEQLGQMAKTMRYAQGFVYTQLTDVMQEVNGLADFDRNPKVDPAEVKRLLNVVEYCVDA